MGKFTLTIAGLSSLSILSKLFSGTSHIPTDLELRNVSSFYGPGCFIAWILTAVPTLLSCEWRTLVADSDTAAQDIYMDMDMDMESDPQYGASGFSHAADQPGTMTLEPYLDTGMLATTSYPFVASVDLLQRLYRNEEYNPQTDAAVCVCRAGALLALVALLGMLWRSRERLHTDTDTFSFSAKASAHHAVWAILWSTCTLSSSLQPAPTWPFAVLSFVTWCSDYACVWLSFHGNKRASCCLLFWFLPPVQTFIAYGFMMYSSVRGAAMPPPAASVRLSYPRTGARLQDLDQWYPLVCSLLLVTAPLCSVAFKSRGRR